MFERKNIFFFFWGLMIIILSLMIIFSRFPVMMERATAATTWKPNVEISPTCPRCGSMNTKFCYYNNYSLTQPRYFCKGCRRYWTKGGSLRNVPVGGGCRKTRRPKSSSSSIRLVSTTDGHRRGGVFIAQEGISAATDNNNPVATAGTNGPAPNIDLAAVYANFMNQKPHPNPQPQPGGHIPETTTLANNNDGGGGGAGPSFEFSGYPAMLKVDYFVPDAAMAPQDGGFVVDEFGNNNNLAAALFQEQFCGESLPPILPPHQELTTSEGWPNHNSDMNMNMNMNMMFPLHTISSVHHEPEVQGCPNHHTSSSSSLFSIPTTFDSIFRP